MAIIYLQAGNVMAMLQAETAARPDDLKVEFVAQTLTLVGAAGVSQSPIRVSNTITFGQHANFNPKKYSLSASFNPSQVVSRAAITLDVNSYLAMNDHARTVLSDSASNTITFSQSVLNQRSFVGQMILTDGVAFTIARNVPAANTFELRSSVAIYKHHDPRFIAISFPDPVPNFQGINMVCGSNSILLRTPEIGNGNEIEHLRINRETRAGERIIYKDPMWPVLERFNYNFENLSKVQAANLLEFISRSLGLMITLTDHENIVWSVQLKNPDAEVKQDGSCSFSTELEFEGARV